MKQPAFIRVLTELHALNFQLEQFHHRSAFDLHVFLAQVLKRCPRLHKLEHLQLGYQDRCKSSQEEG